MGAAPLDFAGADLSFTFPATCTNRQTDGEETDVDCGGGKCGPCGDGRRCVRGADCGSQVCANNECAGSSCGDGLMNGAETDVDCGGGCAGCGLDKACRMAADCASANCVNNRCLASPCSDNLKNGDETDVDCGGAKCPRCADGKVDVALQTRKQLNVLLGNGDGTLQGPRGFSVPDEGFSVSGDFNEDGRPDVAVATSPNGLHVLLNTTK